MVNVVIFDLDGTLADTMDDLMTAINRMLVRLGYEERTKAELIRFINRGTRYFVKKSLPEEVQNVDFIIDSGIQAYKEEYEKCYLEKTAPYDGIEAMLMDLKAKGIKLAVLSNKQDKFVKDIVFKLFDKKTFTVVEGHDKLPTKPNPTSTLAIAKSMGIKPTECLFVGDSDVDIKTAQNAGMRSVGVCWGYRGQDVLENADATFVIKKPGDVCEIVDHLKNEATTRRQLKTNPDMQKATESCEHFNKKLLATGEFNIASLSATSEINIKSLEQAGENNTKKSKQAKKAKTSK